MEENNNNLHVGFLKSMLEDIRIARIAICIVSIFVSNFSVLSQHKPLQYHGGPVLRSFKIYPLYYGTWNNDDITAQQNYLEGFAGYLSGKDKPTDQQPVTWQYGVYDASIAQAATDNSNPTPKTLSVTDIQNIIKRNQNDKKLPDFNSNTLIILFPAHGFKFSSCDGCGFHNAESSSAFWAVVPHDASVGTPISGHVPDAPGPFQLVTGHEIIDAALNPAIDHSQGWDEAVDDCPDGMASHGGTWINLSFGWIPGATDNTQNGPCSTTGYTSTGEEQIYGWSFTDYKKKYDELWPKGWRLYILQSYLTADGKVLYNAVWRVCVSDEEQIYSSTYSEYRKKYDEIYPKGWRLYILQSYVTSDGKTLYNAVWRKGDLGETQTYASLFDQYKSQYDNIWKEKSRLQSLQSYVTDGQVLYNAVWRPGDCEEQQIYGCSLGEFKKKYKELWPQGWRLYILQSYVMPKGKVLYNAVWRADGMPEKQVYRMSYADYQKKYDELWTLGWRLYILDSFVENGKVFFNAVWRLGTYDRPL
jgi:hypothetical protein